MTQFEFLMAIASVVIAMGMAEVVSGWGRLLRSRIDITLDWLYLLWTFLVLIGGLVYWTSMWPYGFQQFTYMFQVWFLVFPSLFLVLLAYAITPELPESGSFDLRGYYVEKRPQIFGSYAMFLALAALADYLIVSSLQPILPMLSIILLTLAIVKNLWVHYGITAIFVLLFSLTAFAELEEIFGDISTSIEAGT